MFYFKLVSILLALGLTLETAEARDVFDMAAEDGAVLGLGYRNLGSMSAYGVFGHAHESADDPEPSGSYGLHIEMAGLPFFTINDGFFGLEAEGSFGLPWNYFGGLNLSAGVLIRPFLLPIIRPSLGFGIGLGSHAYGYVQPRIAMGLGVIDLEFSCMWIPQYASSMWGEGGLLESGIGHLRPRGSVFIALDERNDMGSAVGIRIFVERHTFSGNAQRLLEKGVVEGEYWGGGIGVAF